MDCYTTCRRLKSYMPQPFGLICVTEFLEHRMLQDRVNALEKELALKEAKLASFEQQQQDVTSGGGDVARGVCFGENDQNSLESNMTDFGNQFSHEVSKMKSWLGDHGCVTCSRTADQLCLSCKDESLTMTACHHVHIRAIRSVQD